MSHRENDAGSPGWSSLALSGSPPLNLAQLALLIKQARRHACLFDLLLDPPPLTPFSPAMPSVFLSGSLKQGRKMVGLPVCVCVPHPCGGLYNLYFPGAQVSGVVGKRACIWKPSGNASEFPYGNQVAMRLNSPRTEKGILFFLLAR